MADSSTSPSSTAPSRTPSPDPTPLSVSRSSRSSRSPSLSRTPSPNPNPSATPGHSPPSSPTRALTAPLRRRRAAAAKSAAAHTDRSPTIPSSPKMFGANRKYMPLPTGDQRQRKRAGGGFTVWKRYVILGALAVLGLFVVSQMFTRPHNDEAYGGEDDTYTPNLPNNEGYHDADGYGNGVAHKGDDKEDDQTLNILPVGDTSNPYDAGADDKNVSNKKPITSSPDTSKVDPEDDEAEDEPETSPTESNAASSTEAQTDPVKAGDADPTQGHPQSFETDPDASSTTYCTKPYSEDKPLVQYALTIDAGSTGSRIHVYKFHNCEAAPQLEYETFKMIQGGLSSYAKDPSAAAESLDVLLEEAKRVVPKTLWNCTPVEVKATAGLRLLGEKDSAAILDEVRTRLETKYKFVVNGEKAVEIMDGEHEGVYAWITANYLLKKIGEGVTTSDTIAVMDLGGASTQIVFEPKFVDPKETITKDDHKHELTFGGKKFLLYQHSYLGYGLMRARRSIHNLVGFTWSFSSAPEDWTTIDEKTKISNPCLANGMERVVSLEQPGRPSVNVTMHGGNSGYEACKRVVELVMAKDAICEVQPCSFNGVYQPSLVDTFKGGKLLALSYFTDRIKPLLPEGQGELTVGDLKSLATDVCAGRDSWEKRWGKDKAAMEELDGRPEYCLDLTFMHALLGLGYELRPQRELVVEKKLNGVELGWALGAGLALVQSADLKCIA